MRIRAVVLILLLISGVSSMQAQPCLPDGITFTTQSQIDSFQINYPNCSEIEGNVWIWNTYGSEITNLNGLSVLTSIDRCLEIADFSNLTDLSGLNNLTSVGWDLLLSYNFGLLSTSGLDSLSYIGRDLIIIYNTSLVDLGGLQNVSFIGRDIWIGYNEQLTSLSGLQGLTTIHGNLNIGDEGWTHISGNASLQSLSGLDNVSNIEGNLVIYLNGSLTSLSGLQSLTSVGGYFWINSNAVLQDLTGLDALTSVDDFWLSANPNLLNVNSVTKLTTIGNELQITENPMLLDLIGLDSLISVEGIKIKRNNSLEELEGINSVDYETLTNLEINDNPALSKCAVESVCDYLLANVGLIEISDNAPGCNSQEEVEKACPVGITGQQSATHLSAYPNPFTTYTTIEFELNENSRFQISIFNAMGEEVYQFKDHVKQGNRKITWSPGNIPTGMYYGVLRTEDGVSVVKMVKQR